MKKNISLDLAKKIFLKNTKWTKNDIKQIKPIHNGYTNESFLFILFDNKKFQVRLPHDNKQVNRLSEYEIIKKTKNRNFIYYDQKTGKAIKAWIDGRHPNTKDLISDWFLKKIFIQMKKFHSIKYSKNKKTNIETINFDIYEKFYKKLEKKVLDKYLYVIKNIKQKNYVLCHSDLQPLNILITKNKNVELIDFEWAVYADEYWDFATYFVQTNLDVKFIPKYLKYIKNPSKEKLINYIFLCSVFSYLWSFSMPQTKIIKQYTKYSLKRLNKFKTLFNL